MEKKIKNVKNAKAWKNAKMQRMLKNDERENAQKRTKTQCWVKIASTPLEQFIIWNFFAKVFE